MTNDMSCFDLDLDIALALNAEERSNETTKQVGGIDNVIDTSSLLAVEYERNTDLDAALALSLQQEENKTIGSDVDAALALSLQQEEQEEQREHKSTGVKYEPPSLDIQAGLAQADQNREETLTGDNKTGEDPDYQLALAQAKEENEAATNSSVIGRAWKFVQAVMEEQQNIMIEAIDRGSGDATKELLQFETLGIDDMMYTVELLMDTQANFSFDMINKDITVDIGYHYTRSENLERIKTNGLLTKADRDTQRVASNFNGSVWGDGIYTGNNPFAFSNFGDTGLLVARLKGAVSPARPGGIRFQGDTAIVSKGTNVEMVILRQSKQCVPLLKFKKPSMPNGNTHISICEAHRRLQRVVDTYFNDGARTTLIPAQRSKQQMCIQAESIQGMRQSRPVSTPARRHSEDMNNAFASSIAKPASFTQSRPGVPPNSLGWYQEWKRRQPKTLAADIKAFELLHSPCQTDTYLRTNDTVGTALLETMRVMQYAREKIACDNCGTLVIVYSFINSMQERTIDKNTSCQFIHRIEYLPDTVETRALLERLRYAFCQRILDCVTWPLIPHRTSPYLSSKNHMQACAKALNTFGIPSTKECCASTARTAAPIRKRVG